LKALVVPHAGFIYSGPVAASAYALLRNERPRVRRVLALGPCHRVDLRGLGLSSADGWQSPLGSVPLDRAGAQALVAQGLAQWCDEAHAQEHSVEVQLPFLQRALGDFTLLPVAVGQASAEAVATLIAAAAPPETLVLLSTDLSHYLPYAEALAEDAATCAAILGMDGAALGHDDACGFYPLRGLVRWAGTERLSVRTLDLRNSGDTEGPRDRVVGYGAWAFEDRHGS
jgi:hypothetical protein